MNEPKTARDLIELPGPFRFKVIVKPDLADQQVLSTLTEEVLGRAPQNLKITSNDSKGGKYRAYTLAMHIEVYEEIEALFKAYNDHPASVWVM